MPIGTSKIGVLGAGVVPGGTETFNAPGTFSVPPGVSKVNITGKGGTGNPGNAGGSGNDGTGGYGGTGASYSVSFCCVPQFYGGGPGGYGGNQNSFTSPAGNSGSAGTAGNTGTASTGLGQNFAGGAGGNAGNAGTGGAAGNPGNQGAAGNPGGYFQAGTPNKRAPGGGGAGDTNSGVAGTENPQFISYSTGGTTGGGPGGIAAGQAWSIPGSGVQYNRGSISPIFPEVLAPTSNNPCGSGSTGCGNRGPWPGTPNRCFPYYTHSNSTPPGLQSAAGAMRGRNANVTRAGAGGGSHSPGNPTNVSGGGGGRGSAGNAGNPGNPGSAANPSTVNCVPVTPGSPYPISVGSPGGQIVISWNPQ